MFGIESGVTSDEKVTSDVAIVSVYSTFNRICEKLSLLSKKPAQNPVFGPFWRRKLHTSTENSYIVGILKKIPKFRPPLNPSRFIPKPQSTILFLCLCPLILPRSHHSSLKIKPYISNKANPFDI